MKLVKDFGKSEVRGYLTIGGLNAVVTAARNLGAKDEEMVEVIEKADGDRTMLVWRQA